MQIPLTFQFAMEQQTPQFQPSPGQDFDRQWDIRLNISGQEYLEHWYALSPSILRVENWCTC